MSESVSGFFLALGILILLEGFGMIVGLWEIQKVLQQIAEAVRRDDDDPHPPPPLTTRAKPFSRTPPSSSK